MEGRFAGGKNLKQYWDDKRRKTDDFKFLMRIDKGSSRTSHPVILCMENYGPGRSRRGNADIFSRSPHPTASPQSLATKTNAKKPAHLLRQRFAKEN